MGLLLTKDLFPQVTSDAPFTIAITVRWTSEYISFHWTYSLFPVVLAFFITSNWIQMKHRDLLIILRLIRPLVRDGLLYTLIGISVEFGSLQGFSRLQFVPCGFVI